MYCVPSLGKFFLMDTRETVSAQDCLIAVQRPDPPALRGRASKPQSIPLANKAHQAEACHRTS